MISGTREYTREIHTPQTVVKFLRRTSFKGRRMILGHSSNGSADEQENKKALMDKAKDADQGDLGNPEGHQILRNIYEPLPLGGPPGQEFYINKHSEPSDREAVRSQMRILSVISVKVFEKYGYNYLREIILRRADYQEYKISRKYFQKSHCQIFEDLFLLNNQEKHNHLPKTDKILLHTGSQHVDKKPGDTGIRVGD
ncbi:hypothetical protein Tco_1383469 [Tanacetum coccineum]